MDGTEVQLGVNDLLKITLCALNNGDFRVGVVSP